VAASSGQGGSGAGSAPTAVGADEEGSKAAEPAEVLPPSRREQGAAGSVLAGWLAGCCGCREGKLWCVLLSLESLALGC
jgi:hypothetical protein